MTVSTTSPRTTPAVGDSANKTWTFTFKVTNATDLKIIHVDTDDVENIVSSDFSVSLNVDQEANPGGSVTYPVAASAITNAEYMVVARNEALDQSQDFTFGGNFSEENVEVSLDSLSMQIQQLNERINRTPEFRMSDADAFTTELPVPTANYFMAVNAAGTGLTLVEALETGVLTVSDYVKNNILNVANGAALLAEIDGIGLGPNTFTGTQTMPDLAVTNLITTKDLKATDTIYFNEETDEGTSGAAQNIDWRTAQKRKITLGVATTTFTFTNPPAGPCNLVLRMIQDGSGSRGVVWPASVKWQANVEPTWGTATAAVNVMFLYFDGADYHCSGLLTSS